ncbi:MAG: Gfo/Idh/MocA family oxidoreductase [Lentisphaeria bacterium]|nr:Gfo/Idh/MocA family oxidoreductase [Lentisphaeria bacterium]MBO5990175.1 Gfo/Idh/MocA family oxidoreductase [Lentisphaeria bacterium]MBO7153478.1 Gfo/Idh/MocA family oxidoreductase [Lentisphaeria bacterium]
MEPIKVGVIGFGRSGCGIHASGITKMRDRFNIVAICDEIPERRTHEEFPDAKAYATAEELLADKDVELVIVATYNFSHAKYAIKALDAGKHVLCEKPFGYNTDDVDAMIAAAKRNNKILQPFQQRRYEEDFQKVLEICKSGVLGEIKYIRIAWSGFTRRWDWQTSRAFGGGQLYNNGPHLFDHGLELFGTKEEPKVCSFIRNSLSSGDAEDEFNVTIYGDKSPQIELIISATTALPVDRWLVCGTAGTLTGNTKKLEWKYVDWSKYPEKKLDIVPLEGRVYCSEKLEYITETWEPEAAADSGAGAAPAPAPVKKLYDTLYAAIREGKPQEIKPEDIRRRIAVMQQVYEQNNVPFPKAD